MELKEIKKGSDNNPYKIGTCDFWVYHTLAHCFTLHDYIKAASVKSRCVWKVYSKSTVSNALLVLEKDGYLKFDSKTGAGEHLYIKHGQVKGV